MSQSPKVLLREGEHVEIGVIGAGNVGGTLGRRWAQAGHKVVFGVREPNDEKMRTLLASVSRTPIWSCIHLVRPVSKRSFLASVPAPCLVQ
jgi:lactate dehydrogenase-like 2-hydroxyacid dehydrogenase